MSIGSERGWDQVVPPSWCAACEEYSGHKSTGPKQGWLVQKCSPMWVWTPNTEVPDCVTNVSCNIGINVSVAGLEQLKPIPAAVTLNTVAPLGKLNGDGIGVSKCEHEPVPGVGNAVATA